MITLPEGSPTITQETKFPLGFMLTPNISLDALTRGVVNPGTYPFRITMPYALPDVVNVDPAFDSGRTVDISEHWKIAQNLQYLAAGVIEPLLERYLSQVVIMSAYINPQAVSQSEGDYKSKHFSGEAVDIMFESYAGNMFGIAGDVYNLLKENISEFGLIFSGRSWLHISINGPNSILPITSTKPRVYTRDTLTNQYFSGLFPSRGLTVPNTQNLNKIIDLAPWGEFTRPPWGYL
jgi:hypothetical protein